MGHTYKFFGFYISYTILTLPLSIFHLSSMLLRLFLISMSLLIFCLLFSIVDYVPVNSEIIWYLSLTIWLVLFYFFLSQCDFYSISKEKKNPPKEKLWLKEDCSMKSGQMTTFFVE